MRKSASNKPKVAITIGDCAGIGPEIVIKSLTKSRISRLANFLIIGSNVILEKTKRALKVKLDWKKILPSKEPNFISSPILLLDLENISPEDFVVGRVSAKCGQAALEYLDTGLELLKSGKADILITAPVSKEAISLVKKGFTGHTEYLASMTNSKRVAMLFVSAGLKVALVTRHIPFKSVPANLSQENIYEVIDLTAEALKKYFSLPHPRIAVCGLNPHAGESGLFGREEAGIIKPAILKAKKRRLSVFGPLPADTLFRLALEKKFDAVIALYHDQGLTPFKMLFQEKGANITLGLPFLRLSPDHGTAFDIAGKNLACPNAFIYAVETGIKMWQDAKKR